MCLLIALFKVVPSEPLIVAANRDELYERPAVAITTLRKAGPRVLGGRDEVAGGTWLAVNEYGVVAGLTNLPSPQGRDPAKRSRGELPVALAAHRDAAAAVAWICATVDPADYNPCWLLAGDRQSLFYVDLTGGSRPVARELSAGTYVLENAPLLPESAKAGHVAGLIKAAFAAGNGDVRGALATVLCDHSPGPGAAASRGPASRGPGNSEAAGRSVGGLCPCRRVRDALGHDRDRRSRWPAGRAGRGRPVVPGAAAGRRWAVGGLTEQVLGRRALNRAVLQRQFLVQRASLTPLEAIERLAGMQAQAPNAPYVGLWTRLADFEPSNLARLITERAAVRTHVMRNTIHLVTATDCLNFRAVLKPVLDQGFASSPFARNLAGADLDAVLAAGRALLAERPRTRAELSRLLGPRWPGSDPLSLAYAVTHLEPTVQVPPRGIWGTTGLATYATTEAWLGRRVVPGQVPEDLVTRYLAAFGPATVADLQAWCGLTRMGEVFDRLRPQLRMFRGEQGNAYFDLPDAPRPDPQTPVPPRYLPEYDNISCSRTPTAAGSSPTTAGCPFRPARAAQAAPCSSTDSGGRPGRSPGGATP